MVNHARQTRIHVQTYASIQVACFLLCCRIPPRTFCALHPANQRGARPAPSVDAVHPARGDPQHVPARAESAPRPRPGGRATRHPRCTRRGPGAARGSTFAVRPHGWRDGTGVSAGCSDGVYTRPRSVFAQGGRGGNVWRA